MQTNTATAPRSNAARSRAIRAALTAAGHDATVRQVGHGGNHEIAAADTDAVADTLRGVPWIRTVEADTRGYVHITH